MKGGEIPQKGGDGASRTRGEGVVPVQVRLMPVNGAMKHFKEEVRSEGITMSKKHSWGLQGGFLLVCFLAIIGLMTGNALAGDQKGDYRHNKDHNKTPKCEKSKNMKIIGYNDVQARETLQVSVKRVGSKKFAFIGHHNRGSWQPLHFNDLAGEYEENGTSILDISHPTHPTVVVHIPNFNYDGTAQENRNSRAVTAVYDFMGSGRDFMVRNSEGAGTWYYEVFEITNITRDGGVTYVKLGNLQSTGVDQCGSGCGGILTGAHKGYFSQSGFFYGVGHEPGFQSGNHLVVWDLRNLPSVIPGAWNQELGASRFVGRGWVDGMKDTDEDPRPLGHHHPIVDEEHSRVYGSGRVSGAFNIDFHDGVPHPDAATGVNKRFPTAWQIETVPPYRNQHTTSVFYYDEVSTFSGDALPRAYAFLNEEAGGSDIVPCTGGIRVKAYMMDITAADLFLEGNGKPFPVATYQIPVDDFCKKGGRFGHHQFNETQNGLFNKAPDRIVYFAEFNAGVRAVDISDPYNLKEVGYCIPPDNDRNTGVTADQDALGYKVLQINDVDTDENGLVYATDRVGTGFYVMQYMPENKHDRK